MDGKHGDTCTGKVISDRVNPNKFYGFAAGKIYVSVNGGATFTASPATGLPMEGNADLDAVPGVEGELWFAGGSEEEGPYGLWHSTDSGATFTKLANVEEADSIGFGKAALGKTLLRYTRLHRSMEHVDSSAPMTVGLIGFVSMMISISMLV